MDEWSGVGWDPPGTACRSPAEGSSDRPWRLLLQSVRSGGETMEFAAVAGRDGARALKPAALTRRGLLVDTAAPAGSLLAGAGIVKGYGRITVFHDASLELLIDRCDQAVATILTDPRVAADSGNEAVVACGEPL